MIKNKSQKNIPEGWEKTNLGRIVDFVYGSGLPKDERKNGKVPVFGSNSIIDFHDKFLVEGPGIVVGRKGTIGSVNWVEENFWPIDTTYFIKSIKKINLKWLYYKLQTLNLQKLNTASGVPGLNCEEVYKINIIFPLDIKEQNKIAEVLGEVDERINKVEEVIQKTEELKRGLMQELLTKGIGHKKFKKSKLGIIPERWKLVEIRKIANVKAGNGFPIKYQGSRNGQFPFYKVSDMNLVENKKYMNVSNNYVDKETIKMMRGNIFARGCVIYPKVGAALLGNKRRILTCESLVDNNIGVLIPDTRVTSEFLYYCMLKIDMGKLSGNGALPAVNASTVGNILIKLPKIKEQEEIVCILSSVDEKISINKQIKEKLIELKKGLMQDLLSGRVRV